MAATALDRIHAQRDRAGSDLRPHRERGQDHKRRSHFAQSQVGRDAPAVVSRRRRSSMRREPLPNFFSYSSAHAAFSSDDYVGTLQAGADAPLLRTSDTQLLTSHEFAKSYWITKTSGSYSIVLPSEDRDGVQALGTEIGPHLGRCPASHFARPVPAESPDFPSAPPSPPSLPNISNSLTENSAGNPQQEGFGLNRAVNSNPFITAAVDHGSTTEDASPPMASGAIEFAVSRPRRHAQRIGHSEPAGLPWHVRREFEQ